VKYVWRFLASWCLIHYILFGKVIVKHPGIFNVDGIFNEIKN